MSQSEYLKGKGFNPGWLLTYLTRKLPIKSKLSLIASKLEMIASASFKTEGRERKRGLQIQLFSERPRVGTICSFICNIFLQKTVNKSSSIQYQINSTRVL